jgi:hypothetical protein
LDLPLSRWLWLVKWLLVIPHLVLLALLWVAFVVLGVVALIAVLINGRYPRAIFEFNLGVLRWTWRVAYYAGGALGTDRYPPFTLGPAPDYPATLDVDYPERLSRGLALVKWWLLAIPHYLVIAFFIGAGESAATAADGPNQAGGWSFAGGLIGLLTLFAGVALLFTGRYPAGVFDFLLGMHRWVLRVIAYAALMTDHYPPFRIDLGGAEPPEPAVHEAISQPVLAEPRPGTGWTAGRAVTVVLGALLVVAALGTAVGGTTLLVADRAGRDADGFLSTGAQTLSTPGYALVLDPLELRGDPNAPDPGSVLGQVRVTASSPSGVFIGIGPASDVDGYLGGVERSRLADARSGRRIVPQALPGGAPATPPQQQAFWSASASGTGTQQINWTAAEGRWAIVVMNADGTRPLTATATAGVSAPALHWVWTVLFWAVGPLLVLGAVLIGLALPRHRVESPPTPLVTV